MTRTVRRKREDELRGDSAYRLPNGVCASCGRPTATQTPRDNTHGYGDFHYDCRRDASGRLILRDGKTAA